jgi:hypothetical protein
MQSTAYAMPPSDHRPDERAVEKAMRKNNNEVYTTEARVTSIASELDLLVVQTSDNLEFHLSPPYLPSAVENFSEGQLLKIQYRGQLAPKVLKVEMAGS